MRGRLLTASLVTVGLAATMHLDWHAARPAHHQLSLEWQYHWLLAVPSFALTASYVLRVWPDAVQRASVWIILAASVLAAVVEPAWEYSSSGDWEWAFGARRLSAFFAFLLTGLITYVGCIVLARRQPARALR